MFHELRTASKSLVRRPLFSAIVVLTLALGIGANTTIFSLLDATLLRPLPYPDSEDLVQVWETVERETIERRAFSYPDFLDLRNNSESFESLAAFDMGFFTLSGRERSVRLRGEVVSHSYFETLGARPALGRVPAPPADSPTPAESQNEGQNERLNAEGDALPGPEPDNSDVAWTVLSDALAQRLFGDATKALSEILTLDDESFTVVAVMPPGFSGLDDRAELWIPIEGAPPRLLANRGSRWHSVIGRLSEMQSLEGARSEIQTLFAGLEAEYADDNRGYNADVGNLHTEVFGDLRTPLLVLLGAVGLVLLIACGNVANLMLARAIGQRGETALRVALGADRLQLFRSMLIESILLSMIGAMAGLMIAKLGLAALPHIAPLSMQSLTQVEPGARAFLVATALGLLTGVALAFFVAQTSHRQALSSTMREDAGSLQRVRLRKAVVVAEVTLVLVLAIGAGLLVRSLGALQKVDLGFRGSDLAFLQVDLPQLPEGMDQDEARVLRRTQRERVEAALTSVPGARLATVASDMPLGGGSSATIIGREGDLRQADRPYGGGIRIYRHLVRPDYFDVLGLNMLQGRGFTTSDRDDSPGVAVVSRELAERHWPDTEAVGQRFKLGPPLDPEAQDNDSIEWVTVVGIVESARHRTLVADANASPEDPDVYFALEQFDRGGLSVAVHTETDASSLLPSLARAVGDLDATMVVYGSETIADRRQVQTERSRFNGLLMTLFSAVAALLAAIGLYGVMSFMVTGRTREIGVRLALGARQGEVVRSVVVEGMQLVALGLLLGFAAALALTRILSSLLYQVSATDPLVFTLAGTLLLLIGLASCAGPALRASGVDPARALKSD